MDVRKIKAFITAVKLGSLTNAAEEMNYTQSGLTHMMNSLEKEIGIQLMHRGRNGITLTATGEYLLPRMQKLVKDYDELSDELRRLSGSTASLLRVGAYSSVAQHWLPGIVQSFKSEFPDADVMVQMENIVEIYDKVNRGELDVAFSSRQDSLLGDLSWVPLRNDELVAVLPEDYPVNGALFSVRGFEGREFLMPSFGFDLDIMPAFVNNNVHPNIRYTNMDDPAIISMVEHGLGLSVMTELVMWGRQDRVLSLPLTPPAYRELGIALKSEILNDRLVRGFIEHSRETVMGIYRT